MADTETSYLGLRLPHPFIAGASPLAYSLDSVRRLEDAGAAAVVLHSLFEEQLAHRPDELPDADDFPLTPDAYADHIVRLKRAIEIPVIASLNGTSRTSWLRFARIVEQAGADALELNPYQILTDPRVAGITVEQNLVSLVREVKGIVRIPVAVKLSPFFSAPANMARELDAAGADALVLFNRFYQPDIDIRTMQAVPTLELSTSAELLLRLRWVAVLYGRVRCGLAVSGGVVDRDDGIKAVLAGADVVQLVSALLRHGPGHFAVMRAALERWLDWEHMASLAEARGRCSLERVEDPGAFERAQYMRVLHSWTR